MATRLSLVLVTLALVQQGVQCSTPAVCTADQVVALTKALGANVLTLGSCAAKLANLRGDPTALCSCWNKLPPSFMSENRANMDCKASSTGPTLLEAAQACSGMVPPAPTPSPGGHGGPGGSAHGSEPLLELKHCQTTILTACSTSMTTAMLAGNYAPLMQCATDQRPSLPPVCQNFLDKLNEDDRGVHMMSCGQGLMAVCSTEIAEVAAAASGNPVILPAVMEAYGDLYTCMQTNNETLAPSCEGFYENLRDLIPGGPDDGTAHHKSDSGTAADRQGGAEDGKKHEGGGGMVLGIIVLVVALLAALGAAFHFRSKLQEAEATLATQNDLEMNGLTEAAPAPPNWNSRDQAIMANVPGGGVEDKTDV